VAARRPDGGETPDLPTGELFEERAAVRQFEGRYSREDAECGARDELDGGRS
jgi:hypothetical protein